MIRKGKTICAPATPPGGAISVIRLSGPDSLAICEKIFFPSDKKLNIRKQEGFKVVYGLIRDGRK